MKLKRGDFIFDKNERWNSYNIYFLISHSHGAKWWAIDLGELMYNPYNYNVSEHRVNDTCLKLYLTDLSEERQKFYQEIKEKYINTDKI